jgi:hypothetical protein
MKEFNKWFYSITGFKPYPWQSRLANIPFYDWPNTAEFCTSAGKTSVFLIWYYQYKVLKLPKLPKRIAIVVDRRKLGKQWHREILKWSKKIEDFDHEVIRLIGGDKKFNKIQKRDFVYHTKSITVGTLDLLGMSIFFASYLFSKRAKDMAGGLFLRNTFFVLDEVQINPNLYKMVLKNINERHRCKVLAMSATLPFLEPNTLRFHDDDYTNSDLKHKVSLSRKLSVSLCSKSDKIDKIVEKANEYLTDKPVLIFVNRPETAMHLSKILNSSTVFSGQLRGKEKEERERDIDNAGYSFIICTQAGEIGIDFKKVSNNLITEGADLSSLIQRFGRVGRHNFKDEVKIWCLFTSEEFSNNRMYGTSYKACFDIISKVKDVSLESVDKMLCNISDRTVLFNLSSSYTEDVPTIEDIIEKNINVGKFLRPNNINIYTHIVWRKGIDFDNLEEYFSHYPVSEIEMVRVPFYVTKSFLSDRNQKKFIVGRCGSFETCSNIEDIFPTNIIVVPSDIGGLRSGHFDPSCYDAVDDISIKIRPKKDNKFKAGQKIEKIRHEKKSLCYVPDFSFEHSEYILPLIYLHHGRELEEATHTNWFLHNKDDDEYRHLPDSFWLCGNKVAKHIVPISDLYNSFNKCDIRSLYYYSSVLKRADHIASRDKSKDTIFLHTMSVMDEIVKICDTEDVSDEEKNMLIEVAKHHDLGKMSPEFQQKLKRKKPKNSNIYVRMKFAFNNKDLSKIDVKAKG